MQLGKVDKDEEYTRQLFPHDAAQKGKISV